MIQRQQQQDENREKNETNLEIIRAQNDNQLKANRYYDIIFFGDPISKPYALYVHWIMVHSCVMFQCYWN